LHLPVAPWVYGCIPLQRFDIADATMHVYKRSSRSFEVINREVRSGYALGAAAPP